MQWTGSDGNGAGLASYDIYVKDNDADFKLWLGNTVQTSAVFKGQHGHTYGFFSIAKDNVGYTEASKSQPDAQTEVVLVDGDVNGDGKVDLADLILVLAIVGDIEPPAAVYLEYDINKDGKIGIEEAIFILQKVCGLRQ